LAAAATARGSMLFSKNYEVQVCIVNAPAVTGMANINTVFMDVVMSLLLFSAKSLGYKAKARKDKYVIMFAIWNAAP
jgi:hypothetical protein